MSRGPAVSPDVINSVRRLLSPGRSHREIAEYVGVHRTVVSRIARGVQKARVICDCGYCKQCSNRIACADYRLRKEVKLKSDGKTN